MQLINAAHPSRLGPPALALALALIGLLVMPVPTHAAREPEAAASAGWHGRAIQNPRPRQLVTTTKWPKGWSAGSVGPRSGYARPGGSERVREVQRRLVKLGYRPGPVDGLFGPRTRAATLWFQFKHGLQTTGRVNRPTLTVLTARSEHKPLPTKSRAPSTETVSPPQTRTPEAGTEPVTPPQTTAPAPAAQAPAAAEDHSDRIALAVLLLILALGLGVITGLIGPELRRAMRASRAPADGTRSATTRARAADGRAVARAGAAAGAQASPACPTGRLPPCSVTRSSSRTATRRTTRRRRSHSGAPARAGRSSR